MHLIIFAVVCTAGLFVGMLVFLEIGRRIGVWRLAKDPEGATVGVGTVDGAVFGLLALLAGHSMAGGKRRNWLHMVSFAALIAVAVYVILDLEFPRLGVIRIEAFDHALVDLLESMK